jgi:hypothetical protein
MNRRWVLSSIFSEKRNWALILKNGVKPILADLTFVNSFRIRFNYYSGSNIQFAILVSNQQCDSVAEKIDAHFKNFFSNSTLFSKQPLDLPIESLFIPFPQNSVQYGLYELDLKIEREQENIRQLLSEIILHSLSDHLDDTEILTLGLYLHLALIRSFNEVCNFNLRDSSEYFSKLYFMDGLAGSRIENYFQLNINVFKEIFEDVFLKDMESCNDLFWLTRFRNLFMQESKNYKNSFELYRNFDKNIEEFLGLTAEARKLLAGLIYKTLSFDSTGKFSFRPS